MEITSGVIKSAQKVVIYGPEGIGKSTLASKFSDALFIDTEGSTKHMDVKRTPNPSSFAMLLEQVRYVKANPTICKTLVIDTADWAETLCTNEICAKYQKTGIEDFGYGKGYIYQMEEFGKLLNLLNEVIEVGIHVVLTAHAKMRKFEQPDEMGAYDRWELKLSKQIAPLVKEWADMVLFANYKTMVVNVDNQGATKGKNKVQGGRRIMYTMHHPCWDAKNRHDLKEELPFEYESIAHVFLEVNNNQAPPITYAPPVQSEIVSPPAQQPTTNATQSQRPVESPKQSEPPKQEPVQATPPREHTPSQQLEDVPKELRDLMLENNVLISEIQTVVATKGYYPAGTSISNYDPDFIKGVLVGAWQKVFETIKLNRDGFMNIPYGEESEVPFTV